MEEEKLDRISITSFVSGSRQTRDESVGSGTQWKSQLQLERSMVAAGEPMLRVGMMGAFSCCLAYSRLCL